MPPKSEIRCATCGAQVPLVADFALRDVTAECPNCGHLFAPKGVFDALLRAGRAVGLSDDDAARLGDLLHQDGYEIVERITDAS